MDQNANGTTDENPLTLPNGYTGLTPGDVYAVPTPQLTAPIRSPRPRVYPEPSVQPEHRAAHRHRPPGPLHAGHRTSGQLSTSSDHLLLNDTTSQYNVTFDRPVQSVVHSSQVLSIMGPNGSIMGPQTFGPLGRPADPRRDLDRFRCPRLDPEHQLERYASDRRHHGHAQHPAADSALTAVLIAPDGTTVPLFSGVGTCRPNFINTVFDDSAENSITTGTAPFTGSFIPQYATGSNTLTGLSSLASADGTWHLKITNTRTGVNATLDSWSLNIAPKISVTPVPASESTVNGVLLATEFTVGFPQQQESGTYTIQLGPDILDQFGDGMDSTGTAGLNVLRGVDQTGPTATERYTATDLPKTIVAGTTSPTGVVTPGSVSSNIVVPDNFMIEGDQTAAGLSVMQVQLNLAYQSDPDLTATLYHRAPPAPPRPGRPLPEHGKRHQLGQFQQHGLRRQRADDHPAGQCAVLGHV